MCLRWILPPPAVLTYALTFGLHPSLSLLLAIHNTASHSLLRETPLTGSEYLFSSSIRLAHPSRVLIGLRRPKLFSRMLFPQSSPADIPFLTPNPGSSARSHTRWADCPPNDVFPSVASGYVVPHPTLGTLVPSRPLQRLFQIADLCSLVDPKPHPGPIPEEVSEKLHPCPARNVGRSGLSVMMEREGEKLLEGARGLAHRAPHGDWDIVHRTGIGTPCTARERAVLCA